MSDEKPKLKVLPKVETDSDPFDPVNIGLAAGEVVAGKKVLLKIPVRKPDKVEFFRTHSDPAFCVPTALLEFDREFYLVMPAMRYGVREAQPYELRLSINRSGGLFWWPIRLPGEDGKTYGWWESERAIANLAKESWVRRFSDRAQNMYQPIVAMLELPEPAFPDLTVTELLRLGFAQQVIDSPDAHVLKILRGEV